MRGAARSSKQTRIFAEHSRTTEAHEEAERMTAVRKSARIREPRAKLRAIENKVKELPFKSRLKLRSDIEDLRRVADCLLRRLEDRG